MDYSQDPTFEPKSMSGTFKSEKSGEGFGKKSAMPLSKETADNEPYGRKQK